jgi:hypothetical protein
VKINFLHLLGVTNTRSQTHFYNMHANSQTAGETSHAVHQVPFGNREILRKSLLATALFFCLFKYRMHAASFLFCCPAAARNSMRAATTKSKSDPYCARRSFILFKKAVKFPFLCALAAAAQQRELFAYTRRALRSSSRAHAFLFLPCNPEGQRDEKCCSG